MLAEIALEGAEYRGKKSSRSQVFGEDDNEEEEDGEYEEGEEGEEDEDEDELEEDDDEGEDDDDDDEEVPIRSEMVPPGTSGRSLDDLEREYAESLEQEEDTMASIRQRGEKEKAKGRAVSHQLLLYDRSLEARVLLQRTLQGSMTLPMPNSTSISHKGGSAIKEEERKAALAFSAVRQEALRTIDDLIALESSLILRNEAILPPGVGNETLRASVGALAQDDRVPISDLPSLWGKMEALKTASSSFIDSALDRWHRRAVVVSSLGAAKGGSSQLRALNQSISSQVAAMMRDSSKLVERSRISKDTCPRPLGFKDEDNESSFHYPTLWSHESYDDGEFYQQLLREFLSKSNEGGLLGAGGKISSKKRKAVDRRASKGRKVRYHVHDKMVNFMSREEKEVPPFAAQLFANLFN